VLLDSDAVKGHSFSPGCPPASRGLPSGEDLNRRRFEEYKDEDLFRSFAFIVTCASALVISFIGISKQIEQHSLALRFRSHDWSAISGRPSLNLPHPPPPPRPASPRGPHSYQLILI